MNMMTIENLIIEKKMNKKQKFDINKREKLMKIPFFLFS